MFVRAFLFLGIVAVGSAANAQLMPTYGSINGFTNYHSESAYGFPASLIFMDSHSAFIASFLGSSGSWPIDIFSQLSPTDESTETSVEVNVSFEMGSSSSLKFRAGSTGAWWMFVVEDTNGNMFYSTEGWGDAYGEFGLDGGSYQMRYYSSNSFWSGGSYQITTLQMDLVPEPASLAAMSLGLVAIARRRSRTAR